MKSAEGHTALKRMCPPLFSFSPQSLNPSRAHAGQQMDGVRNPSTDDPVVTGKKKSAPAGSGLDVRAKPRAAHSAYVCSDVI